MLDNIKLGVKLIGGFVLVAVIAAIVGGSGMFGLKQVMTATDEIGDVALPSVKGSLEMANAYAVGQLELRTLLNPDLNDSDKKRQYESIVKAGEDFIKIKAAYEKIPRTPQQEVLWQSLVKSVGEYEAERDRVLGMFKEIDALDLGNPAVLQGKLAGFKG